MKYKGIELKKGNAELFVDVEVTEAFEDTEERNEFMDMVLAPLEDAFKDYPETVCVEIAGDNILRVSSDAITFDINGMIALTDIYRMVVIFLYEYTEVAVNVGIRLGSGNCFTRADGTECKEGITPLDLFLDNIAYEDDELWKKKEAT